MLRSPNFLGAVSCHYQWKIPRQTLHDGNSQDRCTKDIQNYLRAVCEQYRWIPESPHYKYANIPKYKKNPKDVLEHLR